METGFIKSLLGQVVPRIYVLNHSLSWEESDRVAAKVAVYLLARHANEEQFAEVMVKHGALPALVKHLQAPPLEEGEQREKHLEHHVEEGSAAILTILAKNAIVQRGAVRPLIQMLQSPDVNVREMATLALQQLAQDKHNQAGIAHEGGLLAFLGLLDSESGPFEAAAANVLDCLLSDEDNLSEFITIDGFQMLQHVKLTSHAAESYVARTLKSLEKKIHGQVLKDLVYLMQASEKTIQERVGFALAHLCCPVDHQRIILHNSGLELLLGWLTSTCPQQQLDGGVALLKLASNPVYLSPVDAAPRLPKSQVYLRKKYKKKTMPSDVTFWVEGEQFYAHKFFFSASSDAFRAMFDGNYEEKNAIDIEIPNIRREVFVAMMRFIYTGSVDITSDIAEDLLRATDQYLMEELKRLCQGAIAESLSLENIATILELSEDAKAPSLKKSCILFILEHFAEFWQRFSNIIQGIVPLIRDYFSEVLTTLTSMQKAANQSH